MTENETPFAARPRRKPPRTRLVLFLRMARDNYRVGGGLKTSVLVAWFDSGRYVR